MAREATIQRIETISPIKKADFLELATFEGLGWTCVVKKGDFKPGDPCVYFMIDSELPPEAPWAVFLAEKGSTRIKTMRLRGALSQGLALKTSILMESLHPDNDEIITGIQSDSMVLNSLLNLVGKTRFGGGMT